VYFGLYTLYVPVKKSQKPQIFSFLLNTKNQPTNGVYTQYNSMLP